jgi:hypothetical protein
MSSPNGYSLLNLCDIDQLQNPVYFPSPEDAERRRKHRSRRTPFSNQEQTSPPQQKLNERRTKKLFRLSSPTLFRGRPPHRSISTSRLEYKWPSENII